MRALLIQVVVKPRGRNADDSRGLRALLIQVVVKLCNLLENMDTSLRALLIQVVVKHGKEVLYTKEV